MVQDLALGNEQVGRTARELIATAQAAGDEPTQALAIDRLTSHEKAAWMLRSTLG
jgi:starvation-inducible DNA-binding protein